MTHPFLKLLEQQLPKSTLAHNLVYNEAEKLVGKGYAVTEVHAVLVRLERSLVDEGERRIVTNARESLEIEHDLIEDEEEGKG